MKNIWYPVCMLFAFLFMASCEDTDALKEDIQSLTERVEALENKVTQLNDNMASLHILLQEGIIISSVEYDSVNEMYILKLSDGTVLKLAERNETFGNAPLVGVDADGYWQVSYNNGASWQQVMQGDSQVLAIGEDGITPMFRVSADGHWEISYDEGATYSRVKDEAGNDVLAVYDPDTSMSQVFSEAAVSDDGTALTLTLANGTTVNIPIVPDFFCYFDESITGEQKIARGETREFNLHIKGAGQTVITTPLGWKAALGDADPATDIAVLTVTAPGGSDEASTRATADNTRDISVMALRNGFAIIAKLQVNPIDVAIGGGDGGDDGDDDDTTVESLSLNFSAITGFVDVEGNWNNVHLPVTDPTALQWFHRETSLSTPSTTPMVVGGALQLVQSARGAWNTSNVACHYPGKFERTTYLVTITVQGGTDVDAVNNGGIVGITISNSDDSKRFKMHSSTGADWTRNVTTFNKITSDAPLTRTFYIDMSYASTAGNSSSLSTYDATTDEEIANGINITLYNYTNSFPATIRIQSVTIEKAALP